MRVEVQGLAVEAAREDADGVQHEARPNLSEHLPYTPVSPAEVKPASPACRHPQASRARSDSVET